MAVAVGSLEDDFGSRRRIPLREVLSYILVLSIMFALIVTIRAIGPTTVRSPEPRPQTGPPTMLIMHGGG